MLWKYDVKEHNYQEKQAILTQEHEHMYPYPVKKHLRCIYDESKSENSENITARGASAHQDAQGDNMDHGGGSSFNSQLPHARKWRKSQTPDLITGDPDTGVQTITATTNECPFHSFLSQTKPKKVEEALKMLTDLR